MFVSGIFANEKLDCFVLIFGLSATFLKCQNDILSKKVNEKTNKHKRNWLRTDFSRTRREMAIWFSLAAGVLKWQANVFDQSLSNLSTYGSHSNIIWSGWWKTSWLLSNKLFSWLLCYDKTNWFRELSGNHSVPWSNTFLMIEYHSDGGMETGDRLSRWWTKGDLDLIIMDLWRRNHFRNQRQNYINHQLEDNRKKSSIIRIFVYAKIIWNVCRLSSWYTEVKQRSTMVKKSVNKKNNFLFQGEIICMQMDYLIRRTRRRRSPSHRLLDRQSFCKSVKRKSIVNAEVSF